MKKIVVFILLVTIVFTLGGCMSKNVDPNKVAKRYFYSLLDGDSEEFLSCINKRTLDDKLIENEVTEEEFMKELQNQIDKIKTIFEKNGLSKDKFIFNEVTYKKETTVIVKVSLNNQEMPIPLYKDGDNWYIVDKFIDGIIKTIINARTTGLNEL